MVLLASRFLLGFVILPGSFPLVQLLLLISQISNTKPSSSRHSGSLESLCSFPRYQSSVSNIGSGAASVSTSTSAAATRSSGSTASAASNSTSTSSTAPLQAGSDTPGKAAPPQPPSIPQAPLSTRIWKKVKHEAQHYWHGSKLLAAEVRISARLQWKLLHGESLTRRERRQVSTYTQIPLPRPANEY